MESIINILPESVANQIAAGEVVNRPASAVKELLENAVDAGSTQIELHIQDAGRTLVQVVDNGCGMGEEDARRCFLPHATSKLNNANDLLHIRTMGFRGEALASIAAVAQVELTTRREGDELGIRICNEGGQIKEEEACSCAKGCCFKVRNLYFNTPARRQFLKSDEVEFRYVEEEFNRVALAHPDICFLFYKNGNKIYHLESGNLKKRITQLLGKSYENRLLKVGETIPGLKVSGYICTPEYSIKGRGKQFLFVNRRFIKHPGLSNAIEKAYAGLLPEGKSPVFFLHLEVEPSTIDVNIHPTKTEIRFRDEKLLYGVMLSSVKHSLGVNQMRETIDFGSEEALPYQYRKEGYVPQAPTIHLHPGYNPFTEQEEDISTTAKSGSGWDSVSAPGTYTGTVYGSSGNTDTASASTIKFRHTDNQKYRDAYARSFAMMQSSLNSPEPQPSQMMLECCQEIRQDTIITPNDGEFNTGDRTDNSFTTGESGIRNGKDTGFRANDTERKKSNPNSEAATLKVFQIFDRYIVCPLRSGLTLIDQEAASERIIYNDFCEHKAAAMPSQATLFPQTLEFSTAHSEMLQEIREELNHLGWSIEWIGGKSFMLNAVPPNTQESKAQDTIERILDSYAYQLLHNKASKDERVALATAAQLAVKAGTSLSTEETYYLVNRLFSGISPEISPSGKRILRILSAAEIEQLFR